MKIIKNYFNIKPFDLLIIIILLCLSTLPVFIYQSHLTNTSKVWAELKVDGKIIKKFNLNTEKKTEYLYQALDDDYNLIEVSDNKIRIKEASCIDQICVRRGFIQKPGETIVCLPHKLIIEIKTNDKKSDNEVIFQ